jgi:hypothetical protein
MPAWNPNDYETVDDRLHRYWTEYPEGRIHTELVFHDETRFIVKAYAYVHYDNEAPSATGYAEERVGSSPVNKTSALENAETSAVGRALANLGLSPKGARPSREEMGKADRTAGDLPAETLQAIEQAMLAAPTVQVLTTVGERAGKQDMSAAQRDHLRTVYLQRKNELEAVNS